MTPAAAPPTAGHVLFIRTLGIFEVRSSRAALVLGAGQRRKSALLKYVVSRPRARETIELVAATLWRRSTAEAARINVRGALHALRGAFAPFGAQHTLALEAGVISLDLERVRVDAFAFESLAREALGAGRVELERALALAALYGGPYLAGDECEAWSAPRRAELAALFRSVLARALDDARGALPAATLELERRALGELELEPDDAALALALAERYAATDRRGDARELGRRCVSWGADPGSETALLRALPAREPGDATPRELAWRRTETPHFRGRELDVAMIGDALDLAFDGRGQTVAIVGEAGIGKTRLAGEVLAEAQDRGALVFSIAFERGTPSLGAALAAVDALLRTLDRRTYAPLLAAALAPLLGSLRTAAAWYGNREPLEPMPHPFEARRQRAALMRVLEILASTEPVVLLFDDAHDADEHGCALVARAIALTETQALLAIVTARTEALEASPLAEILDQLGGEITRVDLGPLGERGARELAREIAAEALDPDVVAARAAGNPAEIVRQARAGRDEETRRALETIDALDAPARTALFYLALEPRATLDHRTLAIALELDELAAIDVAEALLAYGAIVESGAGYALANAEFERAIVHGRQAFELEAAHARLGELAAARLDAFAAADHYTQAGAAYRDAALVWTDRSIEEVRFVAATGRLETLRRADALAAGSADAARIARIALARGRAETFAGSARAARESLERGYALAIDAATRARALLELAYLDAFAHRVAEALALCDRVSELLTASSAPELLANAQVVRAQLLGALGNVAACESACAALEDARPAGALRALALNALGSAYLNAGRLDEAETRYERARELARACAAPSEIASIDGNLATLALRRGRFAEARDAYERLAREAILDGHLWAAAVRSRNVAECEIYLGELKRADASLALAERRARRSGNPGLVAEMQMVRGTLERERGDHARARESLHAALAFFGSGRMLRRELEALAYLLDVSRRAGDLETARAFVERGRAIVATLGDVDEVPYFLACAAAACAALRDARAASELERRSAETVASRAPSNRAIETFVMLSEARLALGDRPAAIAHLARARELAANFRSPRYERCFDALAARAARRR